jgi:hypothetical protein
LSRIEAADLQYFNPWQRPALAGRSYSIRQPRQALISPALTKVRQTRSGNLARKTFPSGRWNLAFLWL